MASVKLEELIGEDRVVDLRRFDGVKRLRLLAAASPRDVISYTEDGALFTAGTTVDWPQELVMKNAPPSLRSIEFEVVGDLFVGLGISSEPFPHLAGSSPPFVAEVVVRSAECHAVAIGGQLAEEVVIDGAVLGVVRGVNVDSGEVTSVPKGRTMACVRFVDGTKVAKLGPVAARSVVLPSACEVLDLSDPGSATILWRFGSADIGEVVGGAPGLAIRSDHSVTAAALPTSCHVQLEGDKLTLKLGSTTTAATVSQLSFRGHTLHLVRGLVDGVSLVNTTEVIVGPDTVKDGASNDFVRAFSAAADEHLGRAVMTRASGTVHRVSVRDGCVISGESSVGLATTEVEVGERTEVAGLDPSKLSLLAVTNLRGVSRLGLWVPWSSRAARRQFEEEAKIAAKAGSLELARLSDRRSRLLKVAAETDQPGHVLSVLREAERDARRRTLPIESRERKLLGLSRWLVGYGERIGWPLIVGAALLLSLACIEVGWARLQRRAFWEGFSDHHRYQHAIEFALPGLNVLGLDGAGGLWGIVAKAVSVLFIATAVAAGLRVLRRKE